MQSPTITMQRQQAVEKLEQYEQALRSNPRASTETDRRIADGYKVLAKGGRLIDVNEALKAGGLNLAGIPKLAFARAHVESVAWRPNAYTSKQWDRKRSWSVNTSGIADGGGLYDYGRSQGFMDYRTVIDDRAMWAVPKGTFRADKVQAKDFRAMVPHVPLPHRPKHNLDNYFILFEANWHPEPPRDPYLLRPITGALMEIVAEWDLTDLEIAAVRASTTSR
jgi:hypothetical protein